MRVLLTILMLMLLDLPQMMAQKATKDSLNAAILQYRQNVTQAASTFLNKDIAPASRIKAIEPYPTIYDEKQVGQFRELVLDGQESADVRATALSRIPNRVSGDQQLETLTFTWLGDPKAPAPLRLEALDLAGNLFFTDMRLLDVYPKLLEDPDIRFRVFGFSKLIIHGDDRAQQLLIRGLTQPSSALLPAPTAIGLLSMALKKEYYPAVYEVLQKTQDEPTRLEAVRALGAYLPARKTLIAISLDSTEKETFREAALGALYSGDRENIVTYVTPILNDGKATARLQMVAIQMTINVRQNMSYRSRTRNADAYDLLVKKIADGKGLVRSDDLRSLANKYIQSVRPRY